MQDLPINITDAALLIILALSAFFGFMRGFVKETLSIVGWVGAAFITLYLFPVLSPFTREYIKILLIADIVTGVAIFVLSLVILSYITHAVSDRVKASNMGALDRSLGIIFGIVRAFVLVGIIWLLVIQFVPEEKQPPEVMQAKLLPIVIVSGDFVANLLPPAMRERVLGARKTIEGSSQSLSEKYKAIPESVRENLETGVKDTIEEIDKGYDSLSRQQMENLTKSTEEKQ